MIAKGASHVVGDGLLPNPLGLLNVESSCVRTDLGSMLLSQV
jgi:hypothetical protein